MAVDRARSISGMKNTICFQPDCKNGNNASWLVRKNHVQKGREDVIGHVCWYYSRKNDPPAIDTVSYRLRNKKEKEVD